MGRAPCCEKEGLKKGRWTDAEDKTLIKYIQANGEGSWRTLPKNAGLLRCGKSCRLRWINYLRADLKRGNITEEEENTIVKLHAAIGNRWSVIACHLPGRTDNEIKNYWNSHLSRKIYRFYKHGTEPKPPSKNVVNLTSPNKQRAGRVSRTVAKKFNKKSALNVKLSTTETVATDAQNRTKAITINPMIRVFNQQEEESRIVAVDNDSCKASYHLCPAGGEEDKENEALGPYNYEELEQHIPELNYILESGVEESCGNLRLDMETGNAFMVVEEMIVNDHEIMEKISGDGAGSSSLSDSTREVGYAMNSCVHEDEWFHWGLETGPVGGLTVPWDEGEDMLSWLWDSGIHELGDCQYY